MGEWVSNLPGCIPPLDRSLLIPEILDFNMQHNGHLPMFFFALEDGKDRIAEVSYLEFGRACHRVAHIIQPELRRSQDSTEVVGVLARVDSLLYHAISLGLIRAGLIPLLMSPRNSAPAIVSMMQKTSCRRLLTTESLLASLLSDLRKEFDMLPEPFDITIQEAPWIKEIYPHLGAERDTDAFTPYPASAQRPALNDVMVYLHSSGSTGFPKPIPITHGAQLDSCAFPWTTEIRDLGLNPRVSTIGLPPFHAYAWSCELNYNMFTLTGTCIFPPTSYHEPGVPPITPTSDNILEYARRAGATIIATVPSFLDSWADVPKHTEYLKTLTRVVFAGGPFTFERGERLVRAGVKVRSLYGSTELGIPSHIFLPTDPEDRLWNYVRFSDRTNLRWIPQDDGNILLQALTCDTHHPAVLNIEDVPGYDTSDVFARHPTISGLFKIVGRKDDVIMHASGEKTVPGPIEDIINAQPIIRAAIVFGRGRNQAGLLVEPKSGLLQDFNDLKQRSGFIDKIWPFIDKANRISPQHSRIFREMVLITKPDKPMQMVDKGTVKKKAVLRDYEEEINSLYDSLDHQDNATGENGPNSWSRSDVESWLAEQAKQVNNGNDLDPQESFFEQGFDSLSATFLRSRLLAALKSSPKGTPEKLPQNIVFTKPRIIELAEYLTEFAYFDVFGDIPDKQKEIEEAIHRFSGGLSSEKLEGSLVLPAVVLLTGSTGSLGSFLLQSLLGDGRVKRVYALNRHSDSQSGLERQMASFEDRGLLVDPLKSEKVRFIEGHLASDKLGLSLEVYEKLRATLTVVIHNAWRLDFNLPLSSFHSHIQGTRNLIDLSLSSKHAPSLRFLFTSSISTAQSWPRSLGAYPEELQTDVSYAIGNGYGEGKYVAERVLAASGLQGASFRIGQISSALPNGAWSITDWVPIFVKSSLAVGALPLAEGTISWLPVDAVSMSILDIAFSEIRPSPSLNIVHPRPVGWSDIISNINMALSNHLNIPLLPLIPFSEWYSRVSEKAHSTDEDTIKSVPAIKLLDFFRHFDDPGSLKEDGLRIESGGMAVMSTEKMQQASASLRALRALSLEDADAWISYWKSHGLFSEVF